MNNNVSNLAHIHFTTHGIHLSLVNDQWMVFKYNNGRCEIEFFPEQIDAVEFAIIPMQDHYFEVVVNE